MCLDKKSAAQMILEMKGVVIIVHLQLFWIVMMSQLKPMLKMNQRYRQSAKVRRLLMMPTQWITFLFQKD